MPIYEYSCRKCGDVIEKIQKFSDPPLRRHSGCGGSLIKLVSQSSFQLKGSGWYVTDYAGKAKGEEKSDTSTDGSSSEKGAEKAASGGDTRTESKTEKSADKPARKKDSPSSTSSSASGSSTSGAKTPKAG